MFTKLRYNGEQYFDDRLFILHVVPGTKKGTRVWAVVTRRNSPGYHPWRVDDFSTREAAEQYVRAIEPGTPRISLGGRPPVQPLTYDAYREQLRAEGLKPSLEMVEEQQSMVPFVDISVVSADELDG